MAIIPTDDLIQRASEFAVNAHKRIDHRRKYSKQPYSVHLAAVAKILAGISDDAEMIAAAWLHDTVEDTPATLYDIEQAFGLSVTALVEELTDVSKPSDGNRAARKALDRAHLAAASARAQTVKLADLIDNARDICDHDPIFASVFLDEMADLLDVLDKGDETLMRRARNTWRKCREKLTRQHVRDTLRTESQASAASPDDPFHSSPHLSRLFTNAFVAQEIAEPLRSFDIRQAGGEVKEIMREAELDVVCLRDRGLAVGFARLGEIGRGCCGEYLRPFKRSQILAADASLSDVIQVLTRHQYAFMALVGDDVGAYISRGDINKPVVRMWLFGIITFVEIELTALIQQHFPDNGWRTLLAPGRLEKAIELREERLRREQRCDLLDCLQLSDKGRILLGDARLLATLGLDSRRAAKRVIRELESLRNNLAHAQDIVSYDWAQIVRLSRRIEER